MPAPTRPVIAQQVTHNLSVISGFPEPRIMENQKLADLGLTQDLRGALAPGFKRIAQAFKPDAIITKTECKKLKTVKACVTLVFTRAGGTE